MKRMAVKILCVCLLIGMQISLYGQERALRIGFQTSPTFSWITNSDNLIVRNGGNLGLKLGTTADIYFRENYSFTMGLNLAFHEGGEFLYEIGGNYLPQSELSDEILNTGDKPLPDETKIRYSLQYIEFPIGLKLRTKEFGYKRYFIEAPVFTFSFLTRGRGDIETDDATYEGENIYKDLSVVNIFWGLGGGLEYAISQNNSLIAGLYYQNGLFDFTRDKGWRSIDNPDEDPNDPTDDYLRQTDDSKARVSNIVLKLGIIF